MVVSSGLAPRVALFVVAVAAPPIQFACNPDPSPAPNTPSSSGVFTTEDGVRFRAEVVATDLDVPWSLAFAADGRGFVTERPGRVRVLVNGQVLPDPALTLPDTFAVAEAGLLGIALDPEFSSNGFAYLLYTRNRPGGLGAVNRVVRYREVDNTLAEAVVLLDDIPAARFHDGGRLRFGPDGYLYVAMGDALEEDDAQDLASPSGKIIRIDRDGTTPASNPRASPVYSHGHRNPQGFDWHPVSGALWATEHGNVGNDEVNLITAGANYGWPVIEGMQTMPGMETPVLSFSPSIAPSGGSFHTANAIPAFRTTSSLPPFAASISTACSSTGPIRRASSATSGCSKAASDACGTSSPGPTARSTSSRTIATDAARRPRMTTGSSGSSPRISISGGRLVRGSRAPGTSPRRWPDSSPRTGGGRPVRGRAGSPCR